MKIPNCQSDVTKEWLKYVIKFHSCLATLNDKVEVNEIKMLKVR